MGFNKAFEDKKFMIFYVRKLSKIINKFEKEFLVGQYRNRLWVA